MNESKKTCYHCGLDCPVKDDFSLEIAGVTRPMCCLGCRAVAKAIISQGLEGYYNRRTEYPKTPAELFPESLQQIKLYDNDQVQKTFVKTTDSDIKEVSLILEGIVCAACVWLSESHVKIIKGVVSFKVNYTTNRAELVWDNSQVSLSTILESITNIGYVAYPYTPDSQQVLYKKQRSIMLRKIIVAGLGAMQSMMMAVSIYLGADESKNLFEFLKVMSWVVCTPVVLYSATVFFKPAWRDLKMFSLGMDTPISLAIILSYIASVYAIISNSGEIYFDSISMFVFFLLIGRLLEQGARHKAGLAVESQSKLIPAITTLKTGDKLTEIAVSELKVNDLVLLKVGDTCPADGVIVEGSSSIDESMMTGENLPTYKTVGDSVIAGSINTESSLIIEVQQVGENTVISSILKLIYKAQTERPNIAKITDKVAVWFVSFVLVLAGSTFFYWYLNDPSQALWISISVLVITCPCALSLATPVALTVATSRLSNKGFLLTKSHVIETLDKITDVVFDKTGTLTEGKVVLVKTKLYSDLVEADALKIAASLESYSEHPLANAFSNIDILDNVSDIKIHPGSGISGRISEVNYKIGKESFVGFVDDEINSDYSSVYLASDDKVIAKFYLQDNLRESAAELIKSLTDNNIAVHMFSGDKQEACAKIAKELNLADFRSEMLPEDKLLALKQLQSENKIVMMCGDGVNDGPVLAGADVSIAMSQGTNFIKSQSDVILISDNITDISDNILYAKSTMHVIKQNISWAILYNIVALPLAMVGYIQPWMAAIGMSLSSLFVVLNSLRLMSRNNE